MERKANNMGATYVTVMIRNPAEPDRLPGEDEPFSGIWATRFYEQGSKMRDQVASGGGEAGGDKLKVG